MVSENVEEKVKKLIQYEIDQFYCREAGKTGKLTSDIYIGSFVKKDADGNIVNCNLTSGTERVDGISLAACKSNKAGQPIVYLARGAVVCEDELNFGGLSGAEEGATESFKKAVNALGIALRKKNLA